MGYPRAALSAFSVAVLSFNALSAVRAAVEQQHGIDPNAPAGISLYYVANEIRTGYRGMMIAVPNTAWDHFDRLSGKELSRAFLEIAAHADPRTLRKHPRGVKKLVKKGYAPATSPEVILQQHASSPKGDQRDHLERGGLYHPSSPHAHKRLRRGRHPSFGSLNATTSSAFWPLMVEEVGDCEQADKAQLSIREAREIVQERHPHHPLANASTT